MHDPLQSYPSLGAYSGASPFGLPYAGQQVSPFATTGFGGGIHPQQLQQLQQLQLQQLQLLQQLQGAGQVPQQHLYQNPMATLQHAWGNPLLSQPLLNPQFGPQLSPMLGYQGWPQQQFGYPLAPQSLIGGGLPYGNPLIGNPGIGGIQPLGAPLGMRSLAGGGIGPFGY